MSWADELPPDVPFGTIPCREELDIFSDGDHVVAYSKPSWDFVVKILKEENDAGLLKRHEEALKLEGLVAPFRIIHHEGKPIVIQEKITSFLDERLRALVATGDLTAAKSLVGDYVDFNLRLWRQGGFDWHFRVNHCGLDGKNRIVAFDIGGIRGKPSRKERLRWLFGYFGRKRKKNAEILRHIHPALAVHFYQLARKKLTWRVATRTLRS